MLDNIKLSTENQNIINRLTRVQGFERYQHRNNNYTGFCKYGKLMRLDFRKVFEGGNLVGFRNCEISISPHYHFNNYLHNGNDFTPQDCIKTVADILTYLGIKPKEYDLLKVVNIEFGLNIIPEADIKNLINGISYYKKTAFVVPNPKTPYFKITDATKHKQIKAYAKGLQFVEHPQYGVNRNTFRFEVKSKQTRNICKYGINTVSDLMEIEKYQRLGQELLNEWDSVLILNLEPDLRALRSDEVEYIQTANKVDFWVEMYRVKFARNKEKYYKILQGKNNLHTQIKRQIIDKLIYFQNVTFSTQRKPINIEKDQNSKDHPKEINVENVTPQQNNRLCLVTGLDISMQKKGSKYLGSVGLKWYQENHPDTYKEIELKYLSLKMRTRSTQDQIYYIAHNIRNTKTNPKHNPNNNPKFSRQRFESRHYHPNQLQLTF